MSKRGATEDSRQALGREIKRLRADVKASERILHNSPLMSWEKCAEKWESDLEKTFADCARLKQLVSWLSTETAINLREARDTTGQFAAQLLHRMDKLLGLHDDGVLEDTERDMARFLAGFGGYQTNVSERVLAKFHFYINGSEETLAEVARLHGVPRPAILEDSDDELQEQLWTNSFQNTSSAVEAAGEVSGKLPFTACDAAAVGSVLLDRIQALSAKIATFGRDGAGPECRRYVATVRTAILTNDLPSIFPRHRCCICLEEKLDAAACSRPNCDTAICEECFCQKMLDQSAKGWPEAKAVARLRCDTCPAGSYDEALLKHMCPSSLKLYLQAVRADESTTSSSLAAAERAREFRQIRSQTDAACILHGAIKAALLDTVTIRTPCCSRPFIEIEACCAVGCDECHTFFCGLCLEGSWSREEAHRHVKTCQSRPSSMSDDHFLPLHEWKRHMALRQHRIVEDWVSTRPDLPDQVRRRLLDEDFPLPEPAAA